MILKRISAAAAAVIIMLSCALCAQAEEQWENEPQQYYGDEAQSWQENEGYGSEQYTAEEWENYTEQITESYETEETYSEYVPDEPTLQPTKISLEIGEVKNQRFTAKLNITPEIAVSGALISIEYDSDLLELRSSEINSAEIGGIPVEDSTDGKYTFTYVNTMGTDFSGTYSTLNFRIKDTSMTSTVIYVSVESLEDINLLSIPNVTENGIVNYRKAEPANGELSPTEDGKTITVEKSEKPVPLEELGISDVKSVTVTDNQLAYAEDGKLFTLAVGSTELIVTFNDGAKTIYSIEITDPDAASYGTEISDKKNISTAEDDDDSGVTTAIIIAIAAALGAIAIEYVVIVKPFGSYKKTKPTVYRQDSEETDEEAAPMPDEEAAAENENSEEDE
ncbi:MAG: hypothetical protein ACI4JA_03015 [Oscillospiraceae bacterium]